MNLNDEEVLNHSLIVFFFLIYLTVTTPSLLWNIGNSFNSHIKAQVVSLSIFRDEKVEA